RRVLEFTAQPAPAPAMVTLRGTLHDDHGQALAGLELWCAWDTRSPAPLAVRATTGDDGAFAVSLPPAEGSSYVFELGKGPWLLDGETGWSDSLSHPAAPVHVEARPDVAVALTARRGAVVRGRLLDVDGRPLPFAAVALQHFQHGEDLRSPDADCP